MRWASVAIICLALAACGNPPAPPVIDSHSVSAAPGDLPSGLKLCARQSGTLDSTIKYLKTAVPATATQLEKEWAVDRAAGATDAYFAAYASDQAECDSVDGSPRSPQNKPKLAFNLEVHYRDAATAARVYPNFIAFGTQVSSMMVLKANGVTVAQGATTGLGLNSVYAAAGSSGAQTIFAGIWQDKAFISALFNLDLDLKDSVHIAGRINQRIG